MRTPRKINEPVRRWYIFDWAGNDVFKGKAFRTIDGARDFLEEQVRTLYPDTVDNEERFYEQMDEYQFVDEETYERCAL